MKHNKWIAVLSVAGVLALVGIFTALFVKGREKENLIDRMEARNLALKDAGVGEADVVFTEEKLEKENGISLYNISFHNDAYRYEYEIDAETGIVTGMNIEALFETPDTLASEDICADNTAGENTENPAVSAKPEEGIQEPVPENNHIGLAAAKENVLLDAGLEESEVTYIKEKLELEDGIWVYELDFYTSEGEYEYEINAHTGAVISRNMEMFRSSPSDRSADASGAQPSVDVEQAKNIAVSHAGFSESEVTFSKEELDYDDGKAVYEIVFYNGQTEYEYEVDAVTGDILEYESELMD